MNHVIVAAGGRAARFGAPISKQLYPLCGEPMVSWSLKVFEAEERIHSIILVYPQEASEKEYKEMARRFRRIALVPGGLTRYDSVRNGFEALHAEPDDLVLIHDAARPLLSSSLLDRILQAAAGEKNGVIPAVPISETVKEVQHGRILRTIDRQQLYLAQTPQVFRYSVLKTAYDRVSSSEDLTDEASLVEKAGFDVSVIEGDPKNLKVTEPRDIKIAEFYLKDM